MGRPTKKSTVKPKKTECEVVEISDSEEQVLEEAEEEVSTAFNHEKGISPKFLMVPDGLSRVGYESLDIITLNHPKTGNPALFFMNSKVGHDDASSCQDSFIFEILTFEQPTRSWFVGDSVASDGNLHVVTPLDPLFLILPILAKNAKAQPLADHLFETIPNSVSKTFCAKVSEDEISKIAVKKVFDDIVAYQYDEKLALDWLKHKVNIVSKYFEKKDITRMESSISSNFSLSSVASVSKDPQEYMSYACDLVGEYLQAELKRKLVEFLGLPVETERKRKTEESDSSSNKKLKVDENGTVTPLEDYSAEASGPGTPANTPKGAKAKQLQKAAQGSQSLFKFFGPKK